MSVQPPPFQVFLDEHRDDVLAFLRAMVGPQEAEDCFQETFLSALRAYPRADGRNLHAWILTIARRKAIDHWRAHARCPVPIPDPPDSPRLGAPGNGERDRAIWAAVAELPPGQRAAVALRFAADLRYREVGAALGCSEAAARRRVADALESLRARTTTEEAS